MREERDVACLGCSFYRQRGPRSIQRAATAGWPEMAPASSIPLIEALMQGDSVDQERGKNGVGAAIMDTVSGGHRVACRGVRFEPGALLGADDGAIRGGRKGVGPVGWLAGSRCLCRVGLGKHRRLAGRVGKKRKKRTEKEKKKKRLRFGPSWGIGILFLFPFSQTYFSWFC